MKRIDFIRVLHRNDLRSGQIDLDTTFEMYAVLQHLKYNDVLVYIQEVVKRDQIQDDVLRPLTFDEWANVEIDPEENIKQILKVFEAFDKIIKPL